MRSQKLSIQFLVVAVLGFTGLASQSRGAETPKADKGAEKASASTSNPTAVPAAGTDTATGTSPSVSPAQPKEGAAVPSSTGGTIVEIKTTEGAIKIELADKEAPVSVKNFLGYVNDKFYDGLVFHRVIKDFMIQGGGYSMVSDRLVEKATKPPIANEAKNGLKNARGTLAMARTQDPNSATAQFFINHVSNNNLDYPSFDGHGYAVFGKVIEGLDVVDKIASVKTGVKGGMPDVPLVDVKIISMQIVKPASH